jgi:transposase
MLEEAGEGPSLRMIQSGGLPANPEPGSTRRTRSRLERRQVVEETMRPGAPSVAVIARAHGVNANQVFNWRKLYHAGRLNEKNPEAGLLPVRISDSPRREYPGADGAVARPPSGTIHIELGRVRIRVEGRVDAESLCMVLEHLGQ